MVASVRGAHFRGVTIGQNISPPGPTGFLDNFSGAAELLSDHTPDIGNAWAYFDTGGSPTASTTGAGSAVSNNEDPQQAAYQTMLISTGTNFEISVFLDTATSDNESFAVVLENTTFGQEFFLEMSATVSGDPESGKTSSQIFSIDILGNSEFYYNPNNPGTGNYVSNCEYKMVVSGTAVTCYVDGSIVSSGTIPSFTPGPDRLRLYIGKTASVSSVSLTYT